MTRKKDGRSYIAVHDDAMDHPKIEAMSDTAKVHWLRLTGWSNRHRSDGLVSAAKAKERGPKIFKELTTELIADAGPILELQPDGRYYIHDYLEHQWSRDEIEKRSKDKKDSATYGLHIRWHEKRGIKEPDCEHCAA